MMTICYSYLLSLLFLLLMTHWINTASLRSFLRSSSKWSLDRRHTPFIGNNEVTTSEPVLSRRRPQLVSNGRRRRWFKAEDNDEVEIPIDETNIEELMNTFTIDNESIVLSDNMSSFNSTVAEIKHPLLRKDLVEINQTDELTTVGMNEEISENNNTNIEQAENVFPLTTSNEIIAINSTEAEILPTNVTDVNQEISSEKNETITDNLANIETINNETETASIPISINQTIEEPSTISQTELSTTNQYKQDTAIILLDYTTIPPSTADDSQISTDSKTEIIPEYNTTIVDEVINTITTLVETQNDSASIQEGIDNTTILLDTTQNDSASIQEGIDNTTILLDTTQNNLEITIGRIENITTILDVKQNTIQGIEDTTMISDVIQDDTSTVVLEEDEYSNETVTFLPTTTAKPICDQSCQCFKKCPYGFEINNDTCQCNPPCKNYQCFGNDTCTITKKGQPLCRPENGSEHDRPIRCYQPRDAGYHDVDMRYQNRWYYNPDEDTCHLLVYRGLGGNENNFQNLHECHLECITCAPAPDPGTCLASIPMWYYDHKKNQCSQFQYFGCKGNENKFLRKQDCIDTCITRILNL